MTEKRVPTFLPAFGERWSLWRKAVRKIFSRVAQPPSAVRWKQRSAVP